jgi:hypothetical protein
LRHEKIKSRVFRNVCSHSKSSPEDLGVFDGDDAGADDGDGLWEE